LLSNYLPAGTLVGMVGRLTYWRFGKLLLLIVDETVRDTLLNGLFAG